MTTTCNYRLNLIEDSNGDVVDIEYWHDFCASSALAKGEDAPTLGWPCPEWPDYDVYCEGCKEIVHAAEIESEGHDEFDGQESYTILGLASDAGSIIQLVGEREGSLYLISADHRMAQAIVEHLCDQDDAPIAWAPSWAVSRLADDAPYFHPGEMGR